MTTFAAAVIQAPLHGQNDQTAPREMIRRNGARYAALIERVVALSDPPPRLIVLPVLALNSIGTALRRRNASLPISQRDTALRLADDPALAPIRDVCATHDLYVATSGVEEHPAMPGRYFHTAFILGPQGVVLRSPKTQAHTSAGITLLRDIAEEYVATFGPDSILPVAETPIGRLACLVEGEYLIPESLRIVANKGAQVICHPTAAFNEPGRPPFPAIQQAYAYTHGVYWLSGCPTAEIVDMAAGQLRFAFAGNSVIVGPDGAVIGQVVGSVEGHATATLDLTTQQERRAEQTRSTTPDARWRRLADR